MSSSPAGPLKDLVRSLRERQRVVRYSLRRDGNAPLVWKRRELRRLLDRHGLTALVETGTHWGDTIAFLRPNVQDAWSIEVDPTLHERAVARFRDDPAVHLLLGDSGTVLPDIVAGLDRPALFWLDGHWSGPGTGRADKDTPVVAELEAVLGDLRHDHIVVVDDAPLFDGGEYPTIDEVETLVREHRPSYGIDVADGMIQIVPASA